MIELTKLLRRHSAVNIILTEKLTCVVNYLKERFHLSVVGETGAYKSSKTLAMKQKPIPCYFLLYESV